MHNRINCYKKISFTNQKSGASSMFCDFGLALLQNVLAY